MKALRSGRRALLPHLGHSIFPFSCWLIVKVSVTSRSHLSQWYSYTGITDLPRQFGPAWLATDRHLGPDDTAPESGRKGPCWCPSRRSARLPASHPPPRSYEGAMEEAERAAAG